MKLVPKLTSALVGGMCLVLAANGYLRVRRETAALIVDRACNDARIASGDAVRTIVFESSLTAITLAVLSALIAFSLNQWLVGRPIRALAEKARRIARGDFEGPVSLGSFDELAELGREMNATSERLKVTLEQLRHADRLATVGALAAGVAHELGTPLNVVSARAELLAAGRLGPEDSRESARVITSAVQRIADIVRQLLQFARRTTGERAPRDVAAVVRSAVELLRPIAQKKLITLTVVADEAAQGTVDGAQIQQVVINLVMNAIQASAEGEDVWIDVRRQPQLPPADVGGPTRECICIVVRDHGGGIREEDMERLFEPFFTTKEVGEGTGLGLAVSYGIVRDHGGWILVESAVARGTEFVVCLPHVAAT